MKKLLAFLMVVIAAVSTAFAFSACNLFESNDGNGGSQTETPSGGNNEGGSGTGNGSSSGNQTPSGGGNGSTGGNGGNGSEVHAHKYSWRITSIPTNSAEGKAVGKCSCNDEKSMVLPVLSDGRYNKTNDTATCTVKGKVSYTINLQGESFYFTVETPLKAHNFVDGKCSVCGEKEAPHSHTLVSMSNETGHWVECECGFKTTVVPHSFIYVYEGNYHWQVCEVSGEKTERETHTFNGEFCVCGAEKPHESDEIKSAVIEHVNGEGKYLWDARDINSGKYDFYGAKWRITTYGGDISYEAVAAKHLKSGVTLVSGEQELTLQYENKTAVFTVFITDENGLIEAVEEQAEILNLDEDTLTFDINSASSYVDGLIIKGLFVVGSASRSADRYYGATHVDGRFLDGFDGTTAGLQSCRITAGNISAEPAVIEEFNVMVYSAVESKKEVFISNILIINNYNYRIEHEITLSPDRPFINLEDIPDRMNYFNSDFSAQFIFGTAVYETYSGGTDKYENIRIEGFSTDTPNPVIVGDIQLGCVLQSDEYGIRIIDGKKEYEVFYTVYDPSYTNIRVCRVDGHCELRFELKDGVTVESVKQELLTQNLYVEYYEEVDGKYVHLIPITEDMLSGFDEVDETSFDYQYCSIMFKKSSIGLSFYIPYTVAGATVVCTLNNTAGENFILTDATFNDLANFRNDLCKQIVLYNNGVAVLKGIGNGVGDYMTGYVLEGDMLTLYRHSDIVAYLKVNSSKTSFEKLSASEFTTKTHTTIYNFNHWYFPEIPTSYLRWSGTFTAYDIDYSSGNYFGYVEVHLSGWASSTNEDGYLYQIAGVDYLATWTFGYNNNLSAFVLHFADRDWWFDISTVNGDGSYDLTLTDFTRNTVR